MASDKITKNEIPTAVSAPDPAQEVVSALRQIDKTLTTLATRSEANLRPVSSEANEAIKQYQRIAADLETLPLKR